MRAEARNLWVCASGFNERALALLSAARLQAGGGAARPGGRRLYGNLVAEIPALKGRSLLRLGSVFRRRRRCSRHIVVFHARHGIDKESAAVDRSFLAALQLIDVAILELDGAARLAGRLDRLVAGAIVSSVLSLPDLTVIVCGFGSAFEMVSASAGSANSMASAPSPKFVTILIARPSRSAAKPAGKREPCPRKFGAELARNSARIVSP